LKQSGFYTRDPTINPLERSQKLMDYGMIGKIDKAKRYAEERDRIHIQSLKVTFDGENNPHTVHLVNGVWQCDCDFFHTRGRCSHTMALEIILNDMLPETVYNV
jgi:SWIM zinc finger